MHKLIKFSWYCLVVLISILKQNSYTLLGWPFHILQQNAHTFFGQSFHIIGESQSFLWSVGTYLHHMFVHNSPNVLLSSALRHKCSSQPVERYKSLFIRDRKGYGESTIVGRLVTEVSRQGQNYFINLIILVNLMGLHQTPDFSVIFSNDWRWYWICISHSLASQ